MKKYKLPPFYDDDIMSIINRSIRNEVRDVYNIDKKLKAQKVAILAAYLLIFVNRYSIRNLCNDVINMDARIKALDNKLTEE